MVRYQSKKHSEIVNRIAEISNGITTEYVGRVKGKTYPDIILPERDVEVEMLTSSGLRKKCKLYDLKRKRTLVISVPDDIKDLFDEIILFD